jgi:hypothetical protein
MIFRGILVAFLVILGGILSVPASVAVWQERTVLDENEFVATTNEVFEDESVQVALANRMADRVMERLEIQDRVGTALEELDEGGQDRVPANLEILQIPISTGVRQGIYNVCLRVLQSEQFADIRETVLRTAHSAVSALILDDDAFIQQNGDSVVLDLRPLIIQIVEEVAGERGLEILEEREFPPEAGTVTLVEQSEAPWLWNLLGWLDDFNPIVPIAVFVILALAVVISQNRWRTIIAAGGALVVVAAVVLVALGGPVQELATGWPATDEGQEAAASAYDILLENFRRQQMLLVLVGLGMVAVGTVGRDPRLSRALGRAVTRQDQEDFNFRDWAHDRAAILRGTGLAAAAIILLLWPEASARVVWTIVGITALYLLGLWILVSDSEWARKARGQVGDFFATDPSTDAAPDSFVARRSGWLRIAGIAVALVLVATLPDISYARLIAIAAGVLIYLAMIDYLSRR